MLCIKQNAFLYLADRLEFNPFEHESAVENFECDNDEDDD
jgi:hypothetical protein